MYCKLVFVNFGVYFSYRLKYCVQTRKKIPKIDYEFNEIVSPNPRQ